jgi:hypothetical protein
MSPWSGPRAPTTPGSPCSRLRDALKSHLAKYYAKMDDRAPWED